MAVVGVLAAAVVVLVCCCGSRRRSRRLEWVVLGFIGGVLVASVAGALL
jgi:hypothetical protein